MVQTNSDGPTHARTDAHTYTNCHCDHHKQADNKKCSCHLYVQVTIHVLCKLFKSTQVYRASGSD